MPPQEAEKYRLPESTKLWKLKYDAVRAIKKRAHKNMVLASLLQRRVVVGVEVVESNDAVSSFLESEGHVRADETGSACNQDGHTTGPVDLGGIPYLLLPLNAAPRSGEIPAAGIDKTLET